MSVAAGRLRAGSLDRRLKILRRVINRASNGEAIESWVELATVWAGRRFLRADEDAVGDGSTQQATSSVRFTIRFRRDVSSDMQLVCDGAAYTITGMEEFGAREGLMLYATARTA